jgi:hypothetical protein
VTAEYRPGEVVDITIKGARVDRVDGRWLGCLLGAYRVTVPLDGPRVTVERVAPAEWPPQPGDLWKDRNESVWFALRQRNRGVRLVPGDPVGPLVGYDSDDVMAKVGPLILVRREEVEKP